MPIHLCALTDRDTRTEAAWILQQAIYHVTDAFAAPDKKYALASTPVVDQLSGESIGKFVYTIHACSDCNALLDVDLVLNNATPFSMRFEKRLPASSDANEYYEVELPYGGQHGIIETVNRYAAADVLEGTIQTVYVSALPFELTVFENEEKMNRAFGFDNGIRVGQTDLTVYGLSPTFVSPGTLFDETTEEAPWSLVIGTVQDYRQVVIRLGDAAYSACLTVLNTGFGLLPTLIGRNVFHTRNLNRGKVIAMNAYIKANFIKSAYPKHQ